MVTKTEAIKNFISIKTHHDLANLYSLNMECQVNVAQDGGERVEGDFKGRKWHGWTDGATTWKSFRIPFKAYSEPEYNDTEIKWDLAEHAEAIGMTGWDWKNRVSKWVAFDFDALIGHSDKHAGKLTNEELDKVREAAFNIEWVTIRKSTGGKGLHLYVFLNDIPTQNHNEHAALARAIIGKMSALTGFDFENKVDACGGNLWVWHRKMIGTDGLKLIKQGIPLTEAPPNWQDHLQVITGTRRKSLPQDIEDKGYADIFEELSGQRANVPLDEEHKRLIDYLKENDLFWWWDQDHHMLITHTLHLKAAHKDLQLKGFFDTNSEGTNLNEQNCFCSALRRGAWSVRRYSPGVQEHESWSQDGKGWTRCYLNQEPDLHTSARAFGGLETPRGGFVFREAEVANKATELLGIKLDLKAFYAARETVLKEHKDGRLIVEIERKDQDRADEMQGWLPEKDKWMRIFNRQIAAPAEPETANYDDLVRHLVTETGDDYGWMIKSDGLWRTEPLIHIRVALSSLGLKGDEVTQILGSSVFRCWKVVNKPFQPEYPGEREWNRNAAQFRFLPSRDVENLIYPTWSKVLNHCGSGLNEAVKTNPWCKANGIMKGGEYLKCWIASLFQEPLEPLPYLFLYGPQNSGKSILHEALNLLLTKGYKRADAALISQAGFNAELEGSIVCVVEETDLRKNLQAYNRIKDWVTSLQLMIHRKGDTPYQIPNSTHWIQCQPKNTWIMTSKGPAQIGDLINQPYNAVVNGQLYPSRGFRPTGYKQLFKVTTKRGYSFEATENHPVAVNLNGFEIFLPVSKLEIGTNICLNNHNKFTWGGQGDCDNGYVIGWLLGDGSLRKRFDTIDPILYFYGNKDKVPLLKCKNILTACNILERPDGSFTLAGKQLKYMCNDWDILTKAITPTIESSSHYFYRGFISALIDSDGTVNSRVKRVTIYQSNLPFIQALQRMLLRLGITSSIVHCKKSGKVKCPQGIVNSKNAYALTVINKQNLERLAAITNNEKIRSISTSWHRKDVSVSFIDEVASIESMGEANVFDTTVSDIHCYDSNGIVLHNCANDHQACPIFSGDTRITMVYVESLDPIDLIPKKQIISLLEKEAPDFLAEVLRLELPASMDRLNVPVILTEDKTMVQQLNKTHLEMFIDEKCRQVNGAMIKFSDFYDKFQEWLDPNEIHRWSKIRVGREIPPSFPKGRSHTNAQFYLGNMAWTGDVTVQGVKLILKDGFLDDNA